MKMTTKNPEELKGIIDRAFGRSLVPFKSIEIDFNPKTRLYKVEMR